MKEINYCEKCHLKKRSVDIKKAKEKLENISCNINYNCISTCGPGKKKYVAQLDDEIYITNSFDELIKELNEN